MCSVTAQGWALTRFRRALASGSPALALAAAAEMGWVELADALALTLLLRDKERSRFERVALRWHARYCAEGSGVGLDEAMLVLFLLASLRAEDPELPARVLQAHLAERHAVESSQAVTRWLVERQPPR
jgi:hypothetical protein